MSPPRPKVDLSELLQHADWVAAVARRLVDDPFRADDVVQDTWVAVLRKPPSTAQNLRGWLHRVVSNQARQKGRAQSRRAHRERSAVPREPAASLDELAERAERQREVAGHVLQLDEPFRDVVLLRFFEDLSPPEIAARLEVPLKTVHSRLSRAFEKLRDRLDDDYGDRKSWCVVLAPLAGRPTSTGAATATGSALTATGAWIMTTNAKAAIVAGVTVLAAAGLWRLSDGGPSIETPSLGQANAVPTAVRVPANIERPAAPDAVEVPAREEVEARVATADEPALASPLTLVVHGRAVGMQGEPLVGVRVGAADDSSEGWGRTDAGGLFEVSLSRSPEEDWTAESRWLVVRDEDWITVRKSRVRSGNEQLPHLVVAAPVGSLEGWVEDSAGRPVAGARLSLSPQDKTLFGFPFALDLTRLVSLSVRSDAGGRFSFERFPEAVGLRLHVQAVGYESNDIDLDGSARPLVVRVSRSEESDSVFLEGLVLDRTGFSVEGARVHLASASAVTDSEGWFRVLVSGVGPSTPLCAGREGHLPAIVPNFGAVIEAAAGRPEPVELVLGSAPVEIRGRVVDRSGEPCADWLVSATDETEISQNMVPVTTAEGWARGSSEPVRTRADGSFRLTGLFERDYVVQAYDPATLLRAEGVLRGGDAAGRLVADRTTRTVRGVAVSRDGEPLADIRITVRLDVVETGCCSQSIPGPALVTDETGAFSFENVPARYVHLTYSGEGVLPGRHLFDPERWDGEPVEDLELELTRRCHFRLELSDFSDTADRAVFLNEDGERLQVNRIDAGGMSGFPWALLVDGNSEVLSVAETATTVVLRQGETDLARRDVHLQPSEVTVLRF